MRNSQTTVIACGAILNSTLVDVGCTLVVQAHTLVYRLIYRRSFLVIPRRSLLTLRQTGTRLYFGETFASSNGWRAARAPALEAI
jgi:hypothetical protein